MYMYIYIYINMCVCVSMYVCMYIYIYMCVCVCVFVHICIYRCSQGSPLALATGAVRTDAIYACHTQRDVFKLTVHARCEQSVVKGGFAHPTPSQALGLG